MDRRTEEAGLPSGDVGEDDPGRACRRYVGLLLGLTAAMLGGLCLALAAQGGDHFSAIGRSGDAAWYRNFGGDGVTEIQDQDLFFHGIGRSIDQARQADVIILGSSLVSFAIDPSVVRERLERRYGLKFYNMAFVGVASGEFARQIALKHRLHPRLWIVNADDGGGGGNFFHRNLTRAFGADVRPIPSTRLSRFGAYYEVIRRNLRWRFEDATRDIRRALAAPRAGAIPSFDRDDRTGAADMRGFPRFLADGNPGVKITRDPDCHTTPDVIANARDFVQSLGAPVVLTLVPNFHGCLTQVREVADAIGVETALPARTDYSSWDGGGHLDGRGAADFTGDLVSALEKTRALQRMRENDDRGQR
ncbi:hypothetical protein LQG66_35355 [Bradyrhizobium ontarionense]|uniref:SGNH hydrolase-type esterase domain-containing protein n=1 Tax=Bradyrhizobium ontarionense TaxID=2898149 RepID=A0ABY3RAK3_9BRAD|nr:hypothetical protein [Bradyrhizobium sp. A19]UFZ04404.1 hypothetical protein LQG66_35355 [Bradyrhizobium sp. A19]